MEPVALRLVVLVAPGTDARAARICGAAVSGVDEAAVCAGAACGPLLHPRVHPPALVCVQFVPLDEDVPRLRFAAAPDAALVVSERFAQVVQRPTGPDARLVSVAQHADDAQEDATRTGRVAAAVRAVLAEGARTGHRTAAWR